MPTAGGGAGRMPSAGGGAGRMPSAGGGVSAGARERLAAAMSRYGGVMRDQEGLERLVRTLEGAEGARRETAGAVRDADLDVATVEATNLHAVSAMIAAGALRRAESRGCHRRLDAPETAREAWHTLVRWDGRRLRVTRRAVGAYAAGWNQVTGGAA
jgi:L-aspartate oxidase